MRNKDVQPFIKTDTKAVIYKMSYIVGQSVKQMCNDLCLHSLKDKKKLIEELSPYLKWNIKIEDTVFNAKDEPIKLYPLSGSLERVTVKVDLSSYEFANSLAHSLGWSIAKVIAYCIERSINDFDYVNQYLTEYLEVNMGENQKVIISGIMKDINASLNEDHSMSALLIGIVDELKSSDQNFNDALCQIAEKW